MIPIFSPTLIMVGVIVLLSISNMLFYNYWQDARDDLTVYKAQVLQVQAKLIWILLLLPFAVVLLSGCGPTVIRGDCPQYPLPPASLLKPPLLTPLIPPSSLPPKSAKNTSETESRTR